MKQVLVILLFLFFCQFEFCVGQVQSPQPYKYDFGKTLPSPSFCNDNCVTFFPGLLADAGVLKADADNNAISTGLSGGLFSYVKDDNLVGINNNLENSLMFRASTSNSAGNRFLIDKFGTYGTCGNCTFETKTAMISFKFKLGNSNTIVANQDGEIVLALGKSAPGFSTGGVPTLNLTPSTIFMGIRFSLVNGALSTYVYSNNGWIQRSLPINLSETTTIEIYANNDSTNKDAGGYANMAPRTWFARINGIDQPIFTQTGSLGALDPINSFMIGGYNSPNNSFYIYVDDLRYSTLSSTAAALPVSLKSFKILSESGSKQLSWITSNEMNNKGFEVQRAIDNLSDFKTIEFVDTRAKNGNSQTEILYNFIDREVLKGQIFYYRLRQIDSDGKSSFSPVRSIKPNSIESNLNVFPNPSQGSVTVNTGSSSGKLNMYLVDNTGRIINQFMNVSTSSTRINSLKKGFYTLKIVNTETGEQSAQRLVVQ